LAGLRVDARGCAQKNQTIALKDVTFATGSGELTSGSQVTLIQAANTLKSNPLLKVEIAGHTDSRGSNALNKSLSQKRADSVLRYLVSQGVDGKRLRAVGYGEDQPIAPNTTAEGRALNRRVELRILN
jgi:OOP family OmpA-OmpF porin